MLLEIEDFCPELTSRDLDAVEAEVGVKLPSDYRAFLMRNNGGLPTPDVVDVAGLPGSPTGVQVFRGVGRSIESRNLISSCSELSDRISGKLLPIARDSLGGVFCFSLCDVGTGDVVYVDLEQGAPVVYSVADDFGSFLESLR